MPNPVPLPTKEEEERRAWVTAHHEVVRLAKECFGDRFSNNEIFDRLKISRRTGYRALGNDDRIGKAPGRKPKIPESTIKEMIDYIEQGGCNDVGNVWKHLAEKFAPDCNPKTVQDAVKRSGFKNYRSTVKLESLLDEAIPDGSPAQDKARPDPGPSDPIPRHQPPQHPAFSQPYHHTSAIDPTFNPHASPAAALQAAIEHSQDRSIRWILNDVCQRFPEAAHVATSYLCPEVAQPHAPAITPMSAHPLHHPSLRSSTDSPANHLGRRQRLANCRRCGQEYDRAENTMENRSCLYHKGSPQKIDPAEMGTIETAPEAYIWSCCGGNGEVKGCCKAMHTTKKKRKYGKKRDATEAGLDGEDDSTFIAHDDDTLEDDHAAASALGSVASLTDPNIDSSLQDLQPGSHHHHLPPGLTMQMAAQMATSAPPQQHIEHVSHVQPQVQNGVLRSSSQHSPLPHNDSISLDMQLQNAAGA